jgi:uncharacterized membrane protein YccC
LIASYFFARAEKIWLPLTTLFVMMTEAGFTLRRGVERFVIFALAVMLGSIVFQWLYSGIELSAIYFRLYDVTLGAMIGIICNLLIFPIHPDAEFRRALIAILRADVNYLAAIFSLLFKEANAEENADEKRNKLMMTLTHQTPLWVYQRGYNIALRPGHRHFLIMTERLEQILFSMHRIARYRFEEPVLLILEPTLQAYLQQASKLVEVIINTLRLEKIHEKVGDLNEELTQLENELKKRTPSPLELLDVSKEYILLAALVADLNDLRNSLINLAEALRK